MPPVAREAPGVLEVHGTQAQPGSPRHFRRSSAAALKKVPSSGELREERARARRASLGGSPSTSDHEGIWPSNLPAARPKARAAKPLPAKRRPSLSQQSSDTEAEGFPEEKGLLFPPPVAPSSRGSSRETSSRGNESSDDVVMRSRTASFSSLYSDASDDLTDPETGSVGAASTGSSAELPEATSDVEEDRINLPGLANLDNIGVVSQLRNIDPSIAGTSGLPGKTGTEYPLSQKPIHFTMPVGKAAPEPTVPYDDHAKLVEQMMMHDAERVTNPMNVRNRVVYDAHDASQIYEASTSAPRDAANRRYTGVTDLPPVYLPEDEDDHTLVFDSRFESGNLRRAIQVYGYEYDLILRPDINTRGHTQWFYFSVGNTRKGTKYKINIINLCKDESLYQEGMLPVVYSVKDSIAYGRSWRRSGSNICYYQNNIKRRCGKHYSTLTMTLEFTQDFDTVYIAHCYPYTYTDLQLYIRDLELDPVKRKRFRRRTLCKTLAGNNCNCLTVTTLDCDLESLKSRKAIVISSRVHPGETNASWMMKGCLDFLTGDSLEAQILRDNFVFKIIPMLNPDGVINGNYRCSLAGVDLNRIWSEPSKKLHPTIYYTKAMMKRLQEDRDVHIFCDFHGHSRKRNIFIYGCERKRDVGGLSYPHYRIQEKVFPRILNDVVPDLFSMVDSSFKVQKSKDGTGRVVCWKELGITNAYTLEASFQGPSMGDRAGMHFSMTDLEEMGEMFCKGILEYSNPNLERVEQVCRELEYMYPPKGAMMQMPIVETMEADSDDDGDDQPLFVAVAEGKEAKKKKARRKSSVGKGKTKGGVKKAAGEDKEKATRGGPGPAERRASVTGREGRASFAAERRGSVARARKDGAGKAAAGKAKASAKAKAKKKEAKKSATDFSFINSGGLGDGRAIDLTKGTGLDVNGSAGSSPIKLQNRGGAFLDPSSLEGMEYSADPGSKFQALTDPIAPGSLGFTMGFSPPSQFLEAGSLGEDGGEYRPPVSLRSSSPFEVSAAYLKATGRAPR